MSGYIMDMRKLVGHKTLIQTAASVIVVNDKEQVLLGRRADNNKWGYAGGSIEVDEKVEDCAKRELYEETGLVADELELFMINSGPAIHYTYPNGDEVSNVEIVYVCRKCHGTLTPQADEVKELSFFDVKDISIDMISEPIKPVMAKYINKVTGREKRVIFLGSSVTYGSATGGISFADFLSERNGLTMIKEAVSGTTLVDKDAESYVSRLKTIEADTCDLFVCQLSTNDASLKLPIQKIEEAIDFIIDYVRKKWGCPIAFYTNPKYESVEYGQMVALIKEKAKSLDFTLINMWEDEALNQKLDENRAYYMADPIHPTKAGYLELVTPFMESFGLFN